MMTRFKPLPLAALLLCMSISVAAFAEQLSDARTPDLTVLRGRAFCHEPPGDCGGGSHFGFESNDGQRFKFAAADSAAAIFTDPRVRLKELQLVARLRSGQELEIIRVRSYREGKLHDLYYFCEVCNITTYVPGPCPCCRSELELKETPVSDRGGFA
jgi:hypothetical protein